MAVKLGGNELGWPCDPSLDIRIPSGWVETREGGRSEGLRLQKGHGVAISWDGRVIRHCTSVSHPDGLKCGRVGEVKDSNFKNHLYGTFSVWNVLRCEGENCTDGKGSVCSQAPSAVFVFWWQLRLL